MRLLTAGWVFPISQPPIPDGAVAIKAGAIVAVGARTELRRRFPQAQRTEFPGSALLPGLINCHTHLELPVEPDNGPEPFVPWVVRLIARRRGANPDTAIQTAEAGVQALLRFVFADAALGGKGKMIGFFGGGRPRSEAP